MSLLIFSGLALATALISLNVFTNKQERLQPIPVRVRSRNRE
ncbi:hypothetical protein [Hymenobacter nitidus]|nr:hypothetical protein [Hymenobacter nitidus]